MSSRVLCLSLLAAAAIAMPCRGQVVSPTDPASLYEQAQQPPDVPLSPDAWARFPSDVDFRSRDTWKVLIADVLKDQASIARFPLQVAEGRHWKPFVVLTAATVGLIALDPHDAPYFRRTRTFHGLNTVANGVNTGAAMVLVPAVLYGVSAQRNDSYGKQTIFLAAEAVVDAQIVTVAMKTIDRRLLPVNVPDGRYADTWFEAGLLESKSFPSGHSITAFALADVFSERYKGHRWVPWVTYGLAGVVGFSRLTLQAHFPSDVFAGGVLGIIIPHHILEAVALNPVVPGR